jgi:hypothetical protein
MENSSEVLLGTSSSPFPQRPIVHFEDWQAFVARPNTPIVKLPTWQEYESMSDSGKILLDRARLHYQRTFGPIETPIMEIIHNAAMRLTSMNLHAGPGARPGIIIDGAGTVGKSTIAMQFGRRYEQKITNHHKIKETPSGDLFLPVAYVNLPGEVNILNFNWLLADFYNIPAPKSSKPSFLTKQIIEYAANCATSLVILDDIHFLKMKNRTAETLNNHLKSLANSISATFMYAGINCEGTGLLSEGYRPELIQFSQTGHRFKKFDVYPFSTKTAEDNKSFCTLLTFIEKNLLLYHQPRGTLSSEFGDYIMSRTGGFIGAIVTLLREAGAIAIRDRKECITEKILESIKLDFDSEERYKQFKRSRKAAAAIAKT